VANAGRVGLRCVDGQLVAYRGSFLPVGEEPLDDSTLPPVPVPTAACEDEDAPGLAELRARHLVLTRGRVDEALRSEDRVAIESTVEALDAMVDPAKDGGGREDVLRNRRDLLGTIIEAKVEDARAAHQDAVQWLERARQAGVDPARLRAAERALGLRVGAEPSEPPSTPPTELAEVLPDPEPAEPSPIEPRTPRSL
jgi:hypothetical protein